VSGFAGAEFLQALPWAAGAVLLVLAATFVASKIAHKHSVIDTAWGLLFAAVAVTVFVCSAGEGDPLRRWLLLILPVLWGLRLAQHIGRRTVGKPEDPRYAELLAKAKGNPDLYALRVVYLLQGILAFVISAPILVGAFERGPVWGPAWVGVVVLMRRGQVAGQETYFFRKAATDDPAQLIAEFIRRYYEHLPAVPRELLVDIKQRGLEIAPDLAIGDGALGFWKAIDEVFPGTRHQRCWVHKTANVLNKVALAVQVNMKADLREIYGAPTRAAAEAAIDAFADKYRAKYDKAVACLTKDRERLLTFFDFPAEHWDHLRTSNPIESVFATVRHRTVRTKGSLSPKTACLMVFKLVCAAAKTWRRLKGENQLPKVVRGVKFQDGVEVIEMPAHHAA